MSLARLLDKFSGVVNGCHVEVQSVICLYVGKAYRHEYFSFTHYILFTFCTSIPPHLVVVAANGAVGLNDVSGKAQAVLLLGVDQAQRHDVRVIDGAGVEGFLAVEVQVRAVDGPAPELEVPAGDGDVAVAEDAPAHTGAVGEDWRTSAVEALVCADVVRGILTLLLGVLVGELAVQEETLALGSDEEGGRSSSGVSRGGTGRARGVRLVINPEAAALSGDGQVVDDGTGLDGDEVEGLVRGSGGSGSDGGGNSSAGDESLELHFVWIKWWCWWWW